LSGAIADLNSRAELQPLLTVVVAHIHQGRDETPQRRHGPLLADALD
jgi:hypothetical protein